jgi:glycosyltransferase involved in cell wall biosynthesis
MRIRQQSELRSPGRSGADLRVVNLSLEVSVVLPCLDEAHTVGLCVEQAVAALSALNVSGEVLVVDNGSRDGSAELARRAGARVIVEPRRGYGVALKRGIEEARGRFVIIADADNSYDLSELEPFIRPLREGADFVMGSRRLGTIERGAMPWLNRRIGNPILSGLLNLFFGGRVSDAHCGMRAVSKEAFARMKVREPGMEFASEMVVKAVLAGMRIVEVPITLRPDGRVGRGPHLRPFRDGWRHLRYMLLLSPTYVFMIPAFVLILIGTIALAALGHGPVGIGRFTFDFHYMILGSLFTILGMQILMTGLFAKTYSQTLRLGRNDRVLRFINTWFSLERGLLFGAFLFLTGLAVDTDVLIGWLRQGMGQLNAIRPITLASTLMIIGAQTIFSSFFLSMMLRLPTDPDGD